MAAPAYTVSGLGLDMSAADAMELQSDDGGIDFIDGDIELDLEPSPSHRQDEDVSLDDAASATGEMQDEHAEHDDFMVDQEDVIEEDDADQGDAGGADIELPAFAEATTVNIAQPTTTMDDDDDDELLDYTEDEEYHNPANRSPWLKTHEWVQIQDTQVSDSVEQQNETTAEWQQQEGWTQTQTQDEQTRDVTGQQDQNEQQDETPVSQEHEWTQAQHDQTQDATEQQEQVSADWQQDWTQSHDEQTEEVAGQQEEVSSEWQQQDWAQAQNDEQTENPNEQQDEIPADLQALMSQYSNNKSQSPRRYSQNSEDQDSKEQEIGQHEREHEHLSQSLNQNEEDNHSDDGHGGVPLQGQEESADGEAAHEEPAHQVYGHDDSVEDDRPNSPESFEIPSVTVNFQGNELWLFKQHDFDNSGDWLIEDVSLAKASMSDLIRACRSSLGDDVSNEMEIGFRFDHLLNMELYEDNTACVAVSLERLANYYHQLYANDGNNEPESFYVTLMFRPRFATLLSDIAKFADQGLGYSAFEAAVAAGETHFGIGTAGASSDELTEWDKEDDERGDGEEQERAQGDIQPNAHHGERDQGEGDDTQDAYEEDGVEVYETDKAPANLAAHDEHGSSHDEDHEPEVTIAADVSTNLSKTVVQPERERSRSAAPTEAELEARRLQEQDDLIDYSDEEDEEPAPVKGVEQASATEPSPSSTTVQGDEAVNAQVQEPVADSPRLNQQTSQEQDKTNLDTVEVHAETEHGEPEGDDGDEPSYEDFVQAFEAEDTYPDFQIDEAGDDATDVQYDGDANQDYADYDQYQDPDQEPEPGLMKGDGPALDFDYSGNTTVENNEFTNTDDFLDLDNDAEWAAYEEPAQGHAETTTIGQDDAGTVDEEDGVAGKTGSASAADVQTASSDDANEVSPQGQKRSIDEAGHGADVATNATGTLTYFVCRKRKTGADLFVADAKRPRV